jgi:two-component system CheB/CheR fusion protein
MPDQPTPPARRAGAVAQPVRVVGIGASAGGLEALEQFLTQVPPASGLA